VYILANKFLVDDFKQAVSNHAIDMLETAGSDAAVPEILPLCARLYAGVSEHDSFVRMVFARMGFLQTDMWRRNPTATTEFLAANPEVTLLMLREVGRRREMEIRETHLPSLVTRAPNPTRITNPNETWRVNPS
jgi:hypothetical protein